MLWQQNLLCSKYLGLYYSDPKQPNKKLLRASKDKIRKIYPIQADAELLFLKESPDGENLLFLTEELGKLCFSVIDKLDGTLRQLQKTDLTDLYDGFAADLDGGLEETSLGLRIQENYLIVLFNNGKLIVLERENSDGDAAGPYQKKLDTSLPLKHEDETRYLLEIPSCIANKVYTNRQGGRTALVYSYDPDELITENSLNHILLLFDDERGLTYTGKYECSLANKTLNIRRNENSKIEIAI